MKHNAAFLFSSNLFMDSPLYCDILSLLRVWSHRVWWSTPPSGLEHFHFTEWVCSVSYWLFCFVLHFPSCFYFLCSCCILFVFSAYVLLIAAIASIFCDCSIFFIWSIFGFLAFWSLHLSIVCRMFLHLLCSLLSCESYKPKRMQWKPGVTSTLIRVFNKQFPSFGSFRSFPPFVKTNKWILSFLKDIVKAPSPLILLNLTVSCERNALGPQLMAMSCLNIFF